MTKKEQVMEEALRMAVKHMIWTPTKCPNKKDRCKNPGITLVKYCKSCYVDYFKTLAKRKVG